LKIPADENIRQPEALPATSKARRLRDGLFAPDTPP